MMFMAMLPSIAALLGSRSFVKTSLQEPWSENLSLFTRASPLHHKVKVKPSSTERKSPFHTWRRSMNFAGQVRGRRSKAALTEA